MSEFFSIKRWWLLVIKHWFDYRRRYILSILTIAGMGVAGYVLYLTFNASQHFDIEMQSGIYFTGLFVIGVVYASILFSDLASKAKGISYLTLPASHFEKLLCGFFYGVVVFVVVYTGIFYAINTPAVYYSNSVRYAEWVEWKAAHPEYPDARFRPAPVINVFKYSDDNYRYYYDYPNVAATGWDHEVDEYEDEEYTGPNWFLYLWLGFFAAQAFYALGSVYFGKFSLVKTSVAALALCLIGFLFFSLIYFVLFPSTYHLDYELLYLRERSGEVTYYYHLPAMVERIDLFLLEFFFPPLFWFIAYVRLKEKQI